MKRLIAFFIRQSLFGDLLTIGVIVIGVASLFLIRREIFPNVNFDIITVTTIFPGAVPEEVERLVTSPLEQDLKEVDGIKKMQSVSVEGRSLIILTVDPDQTTADKAKPDVDNVVKRWKVPEGAEDPIVIELESKHTPIIEVSISGELPELELRTVAKEIERELERLPGVASVVPQGIRDVEIRVEADSDKLRRTFVSLEDIIRALKRDNQSIPGGIIEGPKEQYVRTVGSFKSTEDVAATVVRANDLAKPIRVSDVATVTMGLEKATLLHGTNGLPAIGLTILKKERMDAIDLVDSVKARVEQLRPRFGDKVRIDFVRDMSYFIRRRLSILTGNLLVGLGLVLLFLPLLLPFKYALIIAMGEPFAFLGTIALLHSTDNTINMISMIGLIIVSGVLVDDSIVVTENAARLISEGEDPKRAAMKGTWQILPAVAGSLMTTTCAFLPMAFMSGIFGKFVRQIPIAVIVALMVSLFETLFILPAHVAHWVRPAKDEDKNRRKNLIQRSVDRSQRFWDERVVPLYAGWLSVSLRHRYLVAFGFAAFFSFSMFFAFKVMRFVLFPPEGVEVFFVRLETPIGTSLEEHRKLIQPVEKIVATIPAVEMESFTTTVGIHQQDPNDPLTRRGSEFSQIAVNLTPENTRSRKAQQIIDDMRAKLALPAGFTKISFNRVNPGPPVGKPVSLGVRGKEYEKLVPVVTELKRVLAGFSGVTDIQDSYILGKPEFRLAVNAPEAGAAGLSVETIGTTVRAAFEGIAATSIRNVDEEIDVRVSLGPSERADVSTFDRLFIPNPQGNLIPLPRVARVTKSQSLAMMEHEENERELRVTAEVDVAKTSATEVNNKIRALLPDLRKNFPEAYINFGGEDEDTRESMASLGRAFGVAILGIFLILILTFRRLLQPFLVLLTIPMGVVSVIWAFFFHGMPLTFMGMLGVIALAGIIVNNAIVFVDFVNQRRSEGADRWLSINDAAKLRLRPIFLTTVTTVIGILPSAYGIGGLDPFVVPIAMALGWGLMFGAVLTAFVFPAALAILDDISEWMKRRMPRLTGLYAD